MEEKWHCQFCSGLMDETSVLCVSCRAAHHEACFRANGICSTKCCGGTSYGKVSGPRAKIEANSILELKGESSNSTPLILDRNESSLATPPGVRVKHEYKAENGVHSFTFPKAEINTERVVRAFVASIPISALYIAYVWSTDGFGPGSIFGLLCLAFCIFLSVIVLGAQNPLTLEISDTEFKVIDEAMSDRVSSRAVDRHVIDEIEEVNSFFSHCGKELRVVAPGMVKAGPNKVGDYYQEDSFDLGGSLTESELQWLKLCLERFVLTKRR